MSVAVSDVRQIDVSRTSLWRTAGAALMGTVLALSFVAAIDIGLAR